VPSTPGRANFRTGISTWRDRGVLAALVAALLFGASTPLSKLLLGPVSPWLLAGLLYLGSGLGLALLRWIRRAAPVHMSVREVAWLAAAILAGGIAAPVLLMSGLARMPAAGASLLLNTEGVFTALMAWFVFKENFDRRIAMGMAFIILGALVLSWPDGARFGALLPALAVLGACLAWAVDNNLTREVVLIDASFIAMVKGLTAGITNIALALIVGSQLPGPGITAAALIVGFASYGVSLTLFVVALRQLGTARTGAYFSTAPFAGALIALPLLNEALTLQLGLAGLLMGIGVWLHLTERHVHEHTHEPLEHEHEHVHDVHHQHEHAESVAPGMRHRHRHHHLPLTHTHVHFPDTHHRHH
jgi:drug/metabolite transporter (DMT)-like permease